MIESFSIIASPRIRWDILVSVMPSLVPRDGLSIVFSFSVHPHNSVTLFTTSQNNFGCKISLKQVTRLFPFILKNVRPSSLGLLLMWRVWSSLLRCFLHIVFPYLMMVSSTFKQIDTSSTFIVSNTCVRYGEMSECVGKSIAE